MFKHFVTSERPCLLESEMFTFVNRHIHLLMRRNGTSYELDDSKILAIDVNIKHNIFACSDGTEIDLNRNKLEKYAKFLHNIDNTKKGKSQEQNEIITEKYKSRTDVWQARYDTELKSLGNKLVTHFITNGIIIL